MHARLRFPPEADRTLPVGSLVRRSHSEQGECDFGGSTEGDWPCGGLALGAC